MPGHKVELVERLRNGQPYFCPKCNFIIRDAVQTIEGLHVCESCYWDTERVHDARFKGEQCYPDRALRKEINELLVKCENAIYGCPWSGQLGHYEEHGEHCGYGPVFCGNEGCSERLPPADVNRHTAKECLFRRVPCKHCGEEQAISQMEDHLGQCYKYPVRCDRCLTLLQRDELEDHQESRCPIKTMIPECRIRKEREQSEMVGLKLVGDPNHMQSLKSRAEASIGQQQLAIQERLTISQLQALMEQMLERLQLQEQRLSTGEDASAARITQLENEVKKLENEVKKLGRQNPMKKMEEIEKQTTMMKVHISELELQLQASLANAHNGSFLWRIPDVSRRRRDAIDERITSIYSPPFYTGSNGYKMCVRAYLNGDGIGYKTHLSLFFVLMKGEYDPLLKWPFEYKVSLILVDQNHRKHVVQTFKPTPESSSFQRPRSDMNVASGCPQFSKLSVLDDDNYAKDDVMYVKCIIDTSRIFHL